MKPKGENRGEGTFQHTDETIILTLSKTMCHFITSIKPLEIKLIGKAPAHFREEKETLFKEHLLETLKISS